MGLPAFRLAFITLLLGLIAACSEVSIETPTEDGYFPADPPETFQIAFSDGQPTSYTVELNNMDVTHEFIASETGATASGSDLVKYLIPGNNLFRVSAGGSFDQLQFYYDIEGPEMHVTHVEEIDNEIRVFGTAVDRGGIKSLLLDDIEASFDSPAYDNGTRRDFHIILPGSIVEYADTAEEIIAKNNIITVKSEDNYGNYSERVIVRRGAEFNSPAVSARLNNSGVAFLAKELSSYLSGIDLSSEIPTINASFLGTGLKVDVKEFGWRGDFDADIQVVNDNELFDIAVDVNQVVLGVDLTFLLAGIEFKDFGLVDGEVTIDSLHIDTLATLGIETILKTKRDKDGNPVLDENKNEVKESRREIKVDLDDTGLDIDGIYLDANVLPGWTEYILSGLINSFYEVFESKFIPPFIDVIEPVVGSVAELFIETIPLDFALTINDETIEFKADPRTIDTFDGGVNVEVDASIMAEGDPVNKPALGSPAVPEEAPLLAATTPNGRDFHISAALSSNFLNQALLAAHESGLTSITIDVYNNGGLSYDGLLIIKSDEDDIEPGDTFRIVFDPASPPTMELGNAGGAMGKLSLNNAKFAFDFRKQGETEYRRVFGAEVDVSAFFNLGVDESGNLDIGIVGVPNIKVLNIDDTGVLRISERFTNKVIEYLVPLAIPPIAKLLRSVPLPQVAGYGIRPEQIWSPEPYNTHLVFAGSLVKTEDTKVAPNPDTIVHLLGNVVSWVFNNTTIDIKNGTVNVNFEGFNPNQPIGQLQYRFKLDNNEWSEWSERDSVTLERLLGGDHTIEVCSRSPLLKKDPSCAVQSFETALAQ